MGRGPKAGVCCCVGLGTGAGFDVVAVGKLSLVQEEVPPRVASMA